MSASFSAPLGARAVVLGASLAGLLAARVLAERFTEVVLLERDELPEGARPRKGTPHAVHPHGLLARGLQELEALFPGFSDDMVARGGVLGDVLSGSAFYANRQRFAAQPLGRPALGASRLVIEAGLRRRVRALPGVRIITGVDVQPPRIEQGRVVAACWDTREPGSGRSRREELAADLVVDCTGRGSRLPAWLSAWGFDAPAEERVDIGICYTSAYFHRDDDGGVAPALVAEFGAVTNEQPYPGVVIAQEPGDDGVPRWVLGVGGFRGDHAAATLQALRERTARIGSPLLMQVAHAGEPIGEVMRYQMPYSLRRRYERLRRFPIGLLAMGDALTSFNPIYGQGMTVAACEAQALQTLLLRTADLADAGLSLRFFRAAARVIETPWQLAVGGDLSLDCVPGHRPLPARIVNTYLARLFRVAPHDAEVSAAFQQVVHLLAAPPSLFAPRILWRVLRKGEQRSAPSMPQRAGAVNAVEL